MTLIEFKSRTYGANRFFVNPEHVISVYVSALGCHLVTTEIGAGGRNAHILVDEPLNRVLAKLGIEPSVAHPGAPLATAPSITPPIATPAGSAPSGTHAATNATQDQGNAGDRTEPQAPELHADRRMTPRTDETVAPRRYSSLPEFLGR